MATKKVQQYCEVVAKNLDAWHFDSKVEFAQVESQEAYVFYGLDDSEKKQFVMTKKGDVYHFKSAIDAVNWLSKNEGWHLSKTFHSGRRQHWIMAREISIEVNEKSIE